MKRTIKAMLWKEYKFFIKSTFPLFAMYFGAITWGAWYMLKQMDISKALNNEVVTTYIFLYIIGTMIMDGGITFSFSASADNKEGTLNSVLASVRKASEIWIGQFLFCSLLTFISAFVGTVGILFALKVNTTLKFHLGLKSLLLWLIVGPSAGMLYLALNLFLLWVIKYQAFMMIPGMLMPALIFIYIIKNSLKIVQWELSITVALVIFLACLVITFFLIKLIDIVPKQNYVSKL